MPPKAAGDCNVAVKLPHLNTPQTTLFSLHLFPSPPPPPAPVKAATAKAKAAAANVKKGAIRSKAKIRTSVHFHRPSTLKPARAPKYQRRAVPTKDARLDNHSVIK
jgi:hypothetical protein